MEVLNVTDELKEKMVITNNSAKGDMAPNINTSANSITLSADSVDNSHNNNGKSKSGDTTQRDCYAHIYTFERDGTMNKNGAPMKRKVYTVGRRDDNDLQLKRPEVRGKHISIKYDGSKFILVPLVPIQVSDTIRLNGIPWIYKPTELVDNDIISICGRSFKIKFNASVSPTPNKDEPEEFNPEHPCILDRIQELLENLTDLVANKTKPTIDRPRSLSKPVSKEVVKNSNLNSNINNDIDVSPIKSKPATKTTPIAEVPIPTTTTATIKKTTTTAKITIPPKGKNISIVATVPIETPPTLPTPSTPSTPSTPKRKLTPKVQPPSDSDSSESSESEKEDQVVSKSAFGSVKRKPTSTSSVKSVNNLNKSVEIEVGDKIKKDNRRYIPTEPKRNSKPVTHTVATSTKKQPTQIQRKQPTPVIKEEEEEEDDDDDDEESEDEKEIKKEIKKEKHVGKKEKGEEIDIKLSTHQIKDINNGVRGLDRETAKLLTNLLKEEMVPKPAELNQFQANMVVVFDEIEKLKTNLEVAEYLAEPFRVLHRRPHMDAQFLIEYYSNITPFSLRLIQSRVYSRKYTTVKEIFEAIDVLSLNCIYSNVASNEFGANYCLLSLYLRYHFVQEMQKLFKGKVINNELKNCQEALNKGLKEYKKASRIIITHEEEENVDVIDENEKEVNGNQDSEEEESDGERDQEQEDEESEEDE
ncbi:hypothetical protein CYY_002538 [Polysphondylium violaceum]|uniref:FHA domain-containing protein n=1 Tax=Polysphondylium violaceum TaxID=133409 RepID=A0A8J4PY85_9MYCE|nr:hypothetical protein CYY_002538 [Polysphondylium violaceum]